MKHDEYLELAAKKRQDIYRMHKKFPKMSYVEIGKEFDGLKKQRIAQIINRVAAEKKG